VGTSKSDPAGRRARLTDPLPPCPPGTVRSAPAAPTVAVRGEGSEPERLLHPTTVLPSNHSAPRGPAEPRRNPHPTSSVPPRRSVTFHGQSTHQLDPKSRLCLPKRLHALVPADGPDGERVVWLTRGQGGCLWLFTDEEFERRVGELPDAIFGTGLSQSVEREFWASTFKTRLDGSHRVLVPDELRALAGLEPGKEVCVIGMRGRIELWSPERREAVRLADSDYDRIAPTWAASGGGPSIQESLQAMQQQAFQQMQMQEHMEALRKLGFFPGGVLPTAPGALPPSAVPPNTDAPGGEGGH
jgi:MraZ protein